MSAQRRNSKGFTLVEILIVVIILGILAAIVIPQFTNASSDARKNSLTSQLQTVRRGDTACWDMPLHGLGGRPPRGWYAASWDWTKCGLQRPTTSASIPARRCGLGLQPGAPRPTRRSRASPPTTVF